jgi:hypothetical protein
VSQETSTDIRTCYRSSPSPLLLNRRRDRERDDGRDRHKLRHALEPSSVKLAGESSPGSGSPARKARILASSLSAYLPRPDFEMTPARSSRLTYWTVTPSSAAISAVESNLKLLVSFASAEFSPFLLVFWEIFDPQL